MDSKAKLSADERLTSETVRDIIHERIGIGPDWQLTGILDASVEIARRAALHPSPETGGWRPIAEFIGRPNTHWIVCAEGVVGEARFDDEGEWWWANESAGDYHASPIVPQPTVFQPLPAPPEAEG